MAKRSTVNLDKDDNEEEQSRQVSHWTREEEIFQCQCWVEVFETTRPELTKMRMVLGADYGRFQPREKVFATTHVAYLKKHPKWDASEPLNSDDHTEIFGFDVRPRPAESLYDDLRRKLQASESAYEAKKEKELSYMECKELEFLMTNADGLPEQKASIIRKKQEKIMATANETKKNGASRSVVDENRGRDDAREHPKKRGTSKDVVASLDKRVVGVKTSMAELKNQVEGLEGLGSDFESIKEDFRVALNTLSEDLKREIHDLRDSSWARSQRYERSLGKRSPHFIKPLKNCKRMWRCASGPWLVKATTLIMDQSWMFLNHHRSWESGKLGRLMISYRRWNNTWKVSTWWMMLPRSRWRPDT
nr:putative retrotransposon Gag domain, nucleotide-binding alpha-beta plait domain protein [Tanacetum cinerariifolium]